MGVASFPMYSGEPVLHFREDATPVMSAFHSLILLQELMFCKHKIKNLLHYILVYMVYWILQKIFPFFIVHIIKIKLYVTKSISNFPFTRSNCIFLLGIIIELLFNIILPFYRKFYIAAYYRTIKLTSLEESLFKKSLISLWPTTVCNKKV